MEQRLSYFHQIRENESISCIVGKNYRPELDVKYGLNFQV